MADGLQPTIRDVVRQTLLGLAPVAQISKNTQNSNTEAKSQTNINTASVNGPVAATSAASNTAKQEEPAGRALHVSSEKPEVPPKAEPLTESTNQENSHESSADPAVSKELAEKLTWKHKCEIEAVKHNAG